MEIKQREPSEIRSINTLGKAVIATDLMGKITHWNKHAEKLYGASAQDVLGRHILEITLPDVSLPQSKDFANPFRKDRKLHEYIRKHENTDTFTDSNKHRTTEEPPGIIGLSKDITQSKKAQMMIRFLADASTQLAGSLDYNKTLRNITRLIVPDLADWCAIDVLDENGKPELLSVAHVDPEKVTWARKLREKRPIDMNAPQGLPNVIKTGKSEMYKDITDLFLKQTAHNNQERRLLLKIGFRSVMIVPLIARDKILGAITFVMTKESERHYDATDLAFAQDLAGRAAQAIDNATLILQAQTELEERKTTEKKLQKANSQTEEILESIADGFITFDNMWRIVYLNSYAERYLGRKRDELIGNVLWEVYPFDKDSQYYRNHHLAMGKKEVLTFEHYDPETGRSFEIRDYPTENGISMYFRDITHQKKTELQVKEKEIRSRQLFESNIVGITISDHTGSVIEANDAFLSMSGYTRGELNSGKIRLPSLTPAEYTGSDKRKSEEIQKTGVMTPWMKEYVRKNGTQFPVMIGGTITADGGKIIAFVIDLSDQKKAERERNYLLQEKAALLDSTAEGIFGVDLEGKCTFINKAGEQQLGYGVGELLGKNMHTFTHHHRKNGKVYPKRECPLYEAYQKGNGISADNEIIWRKDKIPIDVEYKARPYKVGTNVAGTVISFNDITQRRQREARKDEFLSIASHELKTPITTIKAFTQLLMKYYGYKADKKTLIYLSKMDTQLDRLTNLIRDLLDISKIQAGKLIYNKEVFRLQEFINETIEDGQLTYPNYKIIQKGLTDTSIQADKYRISQVLTNLISNAIKYSPKSDRIIVKVTEGKRNVTITVEDFGIGIPLKERHKIFERYYRISDKKRESFPGLGIGLYISHEIIKRHGGIMRVTGTDGKGSKFHITLPKYTNR